MNDRILVVDDDVLIMDMIERCLEENGYATTTADNGDEAIFFLKTREFDLVLCDIHMDGQDGFAVLAACKALHPQTKVILCSGDVVYATLSRAFASGADSFLAKPFRFGELLHQIKKCLTREQPQNHQGIMAVQAHTPQTFGQKSCSGRSPGQTTRARR